MPHPCSKGIFYRQGRGVDCARFPADRRTDDVENLKWCTDNELSDIGLGVKVAECKMPVAVPQRINLTDKKVGHLIQDRQMHRIRSY